MMRNLEMATRSARGVVRPWLLMSLMALAGAPAAADEPCNPLIDGTYCATQMRAGSRSSGSSPGAPQINSLSDDLGIGSNPTATFGAITFTSSGACIGILRRGACS
jgi:hypothetical protein